MIEVTYVDHMGSDLSVVNAARVSFGKKSDWMPRVHNGEQLVLTPKDAKLNITTSLRLTMRLLRSMSKLLSL